jgi:hypothetical protein
VKGGASDATLCPKHKIVKNAKMCSLWVQASEKARIQKYMKTGYCHAGICSKLGFAPLRKIDRCGVCQDNMYGIGLLAEQGKKEEAMKGLVSSTGLQCQGNEHSDGMCALSNLRAVAFSLNQRAAHTQKKMSAGEWAGVACHTLEQCESAKEHEFSMCREDKPLPVYNSKKCTTHTYHYVNNVELHMGQAVRQGKKVTKHNNHQTNRIHATVEITGHGKTTQGLNLYSLRIPKLRVKANTKGHAVNDDATGTVEKGYFFFEVASSGQLGKLYYSKHYDLSAIDFKRKMASEFMHSLPSRRRRRAQQACTSTA